MRERNLLRELLPKLAPNQSLDPELVDFRRQTLRGGPRGLLEVVADYGAPHSDQGRRRSRGEVRGAAPARQAGSC